MPLKRITVTREDIDWGQPGWGDQCPVAIACRREGIDAMVTYANGTLFIREGTNACVAPEEVVQFVEDFDRELPVEPFQFDLMWGWDNAA